MGEEHTQKSFLVALQRLEFNRAARLDNLQLLLQAAVAVLSAVAVVIPSTRFDAVLAIVLFLLIVAGSGLLVRSRARRALGEKARRATLLVDGLGVCLSSLEIKRLAALTEEDTDELKRNDDPGYFAATEPPGVGRAVTMLQESAFWSTHLFAASVNLFAILLACSVASLLVCLLVSLSLWPQQSSPAIKVFCSVASSLVCVEVALRVYHYHFAAVETNELLSRLETIRGSHHAKDDFILALLDYNSSVEAAPMMAPYVYKWNHEKLDRIWKSRSV